VKYQWTEISGIAKVERNETAPVDADSAHMSILAEACLWLPCSNIKITPRSFNAAAQRGTCTLSLITPTSLLVFGCKSIEIAVIRPLKTNQVSLSYEL
jgi:hypothetical protein